MYISRLLNQLYEIGYSLFSVMGKVVEVFFFTSIGETVREYPNLDNAITLVPNFILDLTLFELCLGFLLPVYIVVSVIKFFIGIFT